MTLDLTNKRDFYYKIFNISFPIVVTSLATIALHLVDTLMISTLSKEAVSAVSLSLKIMFVLFMIVQATNGSMRIFVSRFLGKKDRKSMMSVFLYSLKFNVLVSVFYIAIIKLFSKNILSIFSTNEIYLKYGHEYLNIVLFSYFFMSITLTFYSYFKAIGRTYKLMFFSIITVALNTILNYGFIFGNLGFPALGIKGAAIATLISRIIELCLLLSYLIYKEKKFIVKLLSNHKLSYKNKKNFFEIAVPKILGDISWVFGINIITYLYAQTGIVKFALIAYISIFQDLILTFFNGLNTAFAMILNIKIGEKNNFKNYIKEFIKITFVISFLLSIILFLNINNILSLFDLNQQELIIFKYMLIVLAAFTVIRGIERYLVLGLLDASGDSLYVFLIDSFCMYFITIPMLIVALKVFNANILYLYIISTLRYGFRLIFDITRVRKRNWIKEI